MFANDILLQKIHFWMHRFCAGVQQWSGTDSSLLGVQHWTTLFHRQERDLAIEPSLWPVQLYGTVYQQQFMKLTLTACIRLSASWKHICLLYVV